MAPWKEVWRNIELGKSSFFWGELCEFLRMCKFEIRKNMRPPKGLWSTKNQFEIEVFHLAIGPWKYV